MDTRWLTSSIALAVAALVAGSGSGCQTAREAYYNSTEGLFGYSKRARLVDDVTSARNEQEKAKTTFVSALEQFKSVVHFNGGDLEAMYNKLNDQYKQCESEVGAVKGKIQTVKNVGDALFKEWNGEVEQITDPEIKSTSAKLRDDTLTSYNELLARMDKAAGTMDPVLSKFKDRVLLVKSNLNAQAISKLQGTEVQLGQDIDGLIKEMEASIAEADAFIEKNKAPK